MHVPKALAERPNWIVWRALARNGKTTKLPFQTHRNALASTNNPAHWSSLQAAVDAMDTGKFAGLGFVFAPGDNLFGIDLDSCYGNLYNLDTWAEKIVREFVTYAEVSPSGRGVKLYALGEHRGRGFVRQQGAAEAGGKRPAVEVYGWGRYFAFTGRRLENSPLECMDCQRPLDALKASMGKLDKPHPLPAPTPLFNSGRPLIERGRLYLQKVAPPSKAIGGCNNRTFAAACALIHRIGLSQQEAYTLLEEWNARGDAPWTHEELARKVKDAATKGR